MGMSERCSSRMTSWGTTRATLSKASEPVEARWSSCSFLSSRLCSKGTTGIPLSTTRMRLPMVPAPPQAGHFAQAPRPGPAKCRASGKSLRPPDRNGKLASAWIDHRGLLVGEERRRKVAFAVVAHDGHDALARAELLGHLQGGVQDSPRGDPGQDALLAGEPAGHLTAVL